MYLYTCCFNIRNAAVRHKVTSDKFMFLQGELKLT